jgi:hypothetical protein
MPHRGMWMRRCWHRWSSQGVESNDKKSAAQAVAGAQTPSRATGSGGVGSLPRRICDEGTHRRAHPMPTRARVATAGQRDDSIAFEAVMANLRIGRPGRGRPKTRPDRVLADKAHSSMAIRTALRARRIQARSPARPTRSPAEPTGTARVGGHRRSTRRHTRLQRRRGHHQKGSTRPARRP